MGKVLPEKDVTTKFNLCNSHVDWGGDGLPVLTIKETRDPCRVLHCILRKEAACFLAGRGVRVVGIDYLSVGGFKRDGVETHQILLEGGVWIIEGLDLSTVRQGKYDLICLPLRLDQGDGAPARAILRPVRAGKVR